MAASKRKVFLFSFLHSIWFINTQSKKLIEKNRKNQYDRHIPAMLNCFFGVRAGSGKDKIHRGSGDEKENPPKRCQIVEFAASKGSVLYEVLINLWFDLLWRKVLLKIMQQCLYITQVNIFLKPYFQVCHFFELFRCLKNQIPIFGAILVRLFKKCLSLSTSHK